VTVPSTRFRAHLDARSSLRTAGDLAAWAETVGRLGGVMCSVRVAVESARAALPAWEHDVPESRAPHERIAAVDAWLACPCASHAAAAVDLAWANGDDNAFKGFSRVTVGGKFVESDAATYAHWCSDDAASAIYVRNDAKKVAEVAGLAASRASYALELAGVPIAESVMRVAGAVAQAVHDVNDAVS
jgi:hypothetical protein